MNNIIGIDLGLTRTIVARFNEEGRPEILPNRAGRDITPSVVQILDNGDVIVGEEAKKFVGCDVPNVFAEFQRDIGSDKTWVVNGRTITPTDLCALLLKQVIEECSVQFGKPTAVVISWPANFREEQRQATMEAAKKAGLNVQHFISGPAAAALYHSTDTKLSGHYLIYDFGGGTFDVTIIKANGSDIDVVWSEGVQQLGGKDLDAELLKIIGSKFKAKTGAEFDQVDCSFGKKEVEDVKHALSVRDKHNVRVVSSAHGPVAMEITREEFEAAISHLVTQAEIACETALNNAKLSKADIREVFMAGGTSHAPATQRSVEKLFDKKPIVKNSDKAIACGASIHAASKLRPASLLTPRQQAAMHEVHVVDIAPHHLGSICLDSKTRQPLNSIIIPKGERLPCHKTAIFYTIRDGQDAIDCSVTQSSIAETNPEFVSLIWAGNLSVPPGPAGSEIRLSFGYDANGCINLGIVPPESDGGEMTPTGAPPPHPIASKRILGRHRHLGGPNLDLPDAGVIRGPLTPRPFVLYLRKTP